MSIYKKEIYNEEQFKEEHPELLKLVSSHFTNFKFEDFYFSQCLFDEKFVSVSYISNDNEDITYFFEAEIGKEEEGDFEFSMD